MNLFQSILDKAKNNFSNQDPTQNLQYKAINKLAGGVSAVTGQGMEDPTQSLLYKGLQSGANLYTGTAEEATMGGQREFERKKEVARQFLSKKGYTSDVIENTLSQIEYKPNFMARVTEGLGNRMQEVARTTDTLSQVQNPLQRLGVGTVAYGGDVVATAFEPVASAISPLVQSGIEKAGLTDTVQNLGQKYQGFKERNPLTADVIEGVANIGQLAPIPVGKVAGKALKPAVNATGKAIVRGVEKISVPISEIRKAISVKNANKAQALTDEGLKEIYEAVNPTTRENKAVLRQRVEDLLPYIDENKKFGNDLETVKGRVDADKTKAFRDMEDYETNVGVKGKVDTDSVAKAIADKYQEKIGDSFINADEAKIAQQLIDTLKGFGKTVDDANIIKIRRAWDKIIEKNKGFMQSAEATSKGDIFADANRFFRDEIKKSNPEYAKYLEKAHKTITISDILDATIQRRTGQTQGGFLRKASENTARVVGTGIGTMVGGIPGAFVGAGATEALLAGVGKLTGSSAKLTKGKKLILKNQKNGISSSNIPDSRAPSVVGESKQLTSGPRLKTPVTPKVVKPSPKPIVKNLQKTEKSATIGDMETKKLIEEARNTEYKKKIDNLIDLAKKHYENASGNTKYARTQSGKKEFLLDLESNSGIEWAKSTEEGLKKIGIDPDKAIYIHSFYPKYVKGMGIAKDDFLSKMKEAMSYKLRPNKYFATSSFSEDGANFFDKLVKEGYLKRVTDTVSQYDEFPTFGIPDPVKKYKTGVSSGMNVFELTDKILSYERKIDKEKLFEEAIRGKVIGKPEIYKMFGIK